jgi:hypothetical protein
MQDPFLSVAKKPAANRVVPASAMFAQSVGQSGACWDNSVAKSFFARIVMSGISLTAQPKINHAQTG